MISKFAPDFASNYYRNGMRPLTSNSGSNF